MSRNSGIVRSRYIESKLANKLKPFGYTLVTDRASIKSIASKVGNTKLSSSAMLLVLSQDHEIKPMKSTPASDVGIGHSYSDLVKQLSDLRTRVSSIVSAINILLVSEDERGVGEQSASCENIALSQAANGVIKLGAVIALAADTNFTGLDSNIALDRYRNIGAALIIKTYWGRGWTIKHGLNTPISDLKIIVESNEPMTEPYADDNDPLNVIHVDSVAMDCASGGVAVKRAKHFSGDETDMRALLHEAIEAQNKKYQAESDRRDASERRKQEAERRVSAANLATVFKTKVPGNEQ